ncbi:MAG TPA: methyltransferase domain-containing protein [Spongiibacteraceae bacterium]|nr:methyltransferase domain-containing protein [Spongiibacteraceae bacterium]
MHSSEDAQLGQFIPLHYHHNMLLDEARMQGFRAALDYAVQPGAKVLELGGGTGILSFFAARRAAKVWCVERNPVLVETARRMLSVNSGGEKVTVVCADAFNYLPPEPVDVVICEMLHVGLLREKQIEMIHSFKRRYLEKFGGPLPVFVPEACIQAVQPVQQNFVYEGCFITAPVFQNPVVTSNRTIGLADPVLYQSFTYDSNLTLQCSWRGTIAATQSGSLNALRFVTKNILAIRLDTRSTIDWHNAYLVLPLPQSQQVEAGDLIEIDFSYAVGAPLEALQPAVRVIRAATVRTAEATRLQA